MVVTDFSQYPLSAKYYGGSEKKIGITIDGVDYMLKFQKKTAWGTMNNHLSEYIGSRVFSLLGFDVQETFLGLYHSEQVVACKDFITADRQFVPFNDVGESTLDRDKELYQYDYGDIMRMLQDNSKLTNVNETINMFWRMYIVDALLGNFDRHGSNWGFIKENNKYSLAPVFDNGSSLFPNMTDEAEMQSIIESEVETNKRVYNFPTSQINLNGKKSSYYDVISSLAYDECNKALAYVYNRLDMNKINNIIDNTPFASEVNKQFYKHMLSSRYDKIIKESYQRLIVK